MQPVAMMRFMFKPFIAYSNGVKGDRAFKPEISDQMSMNYNLLLQSIQEKLTLRKLQRLAEERN